MKRLAILVSVALFAFAGFAACGDEDNDNPPQLSTSHPGWQQADCASCHTLANIHSGQRQWTQCLGCHGGNGQPDRPAGHSDSGCTGCHDGTGSAPWNATSHANYAAYDASQCLGCHD